MCLELNRVSKIRFCTATAGSESGVFFCSLLLILCSFNSLAGESRGIATRREELGSLGNSNPSQILVCDFFFNIHYYPNEVAAAAGVFRGLCLTDGGYIGCHSVNYTLEH